MLFSPLILTARTFSSGAVDIAEQPIDKSIYFPFFSPYYRLIGFVDTEVLRQM